jgi:hypothetical protein
MGFDRRAHCTAARQRRDGFWLPRCTQERQDVFFDRLISRPVRCSHGRGRRPPGLLLRGTRRRRIRSLPRAATSHLRPSLLLLGCWERSDPARGIQKSSPSPAEKSPSLFVSVAARTGRESLRRNQYNASAPRLLIVPHKKPAFDYNISILVFASLDSIAAVANSCCCAACAI